MRFKHLAKRNPVLVLVLTNAAGGTLVALGLVAALLLLDIGHLGTLILGSDAPVIAIALLSAGFVVTFSSVAMGSAIMRLGNDGGKTGGGRPARMPAAIPVPVPVPVRRGR